MATLAEWTEGARPRTLPSAIAPVLIGTASAYAIGEWHLGLAILALLVALGLQIGVNFANDYSDGIRGTDEERVGPVRLVGQRLATPRQVKTAAFVCFGFSALAGLALIAWSGTWVLLILGVLSIIAAWYYTGGKKPYGYAGLGEVMVFIFFGLVAVLGTTYTQALRIDLATVAAAIGIGLITCGMLVTNNLRDIDGDAVSGKNTLAVRLGSARTRDMFSAMIIGSFVMVILAALIHPWALLGLLAAPLAIAPVKLMRDPQRVGRALLPALGATGKLQMGYAVALSLGLMLG